MERLLPPGLVLSQFTLALDRWKAQGGLVLMICPAQTIRLPDRDRLLEVLIAEANKVIKPEVSTTSTTLRQGSTWKSRSKRYVRCVCGKPG